MSPNEPGDQSQDLLRRLQAIEGQVRGLARMVTEERPPVEILTQIASVHEALRQVGKLVVRSYLESQTQARDPSRAEELYDDLLQVIYKFVR